MFNKLLAAPNYAALIKEAYLVYPNRIAPDSTYTGSGVGYPHHVIRGNKLVVHKRGLQAAYSRARQQGIFGGEVRRHILKHYRELSLLEASNIEVSYEDLTELQHDQWHRDLLGRFASPGSSGGQRLSSSEHRESRQLARLPMRTLSNTELTTLNNRLNLESSTRSARRNNSAIKRGETIVKTALGVGTTIGAVITFAQSKTGQQIADVVAKAITPSTIELF